MKNQFLAAMKAEGITQSEMARRLGLSSYAWRKRLNGLSPLNARVVADAIGYTLRIVLVKKNEQSKEKENQGAEVRDSTGAENGGSRAIGP